VLIQRVKTPKLDYGRPLPVTQEDREWQAKLMPADAQVIALVNAFVRSVDAERRRMPRSQIEDQLRLGYPAGAFNELHWNEYADAQAEEMTHALLPVYMDAARQEAQAFAALHIAKSVDPLPGWAANFSLVNQYAVIAARTVIGKLIRNISAAQLRAVQWYMARTILEGIAPAQSAATLGTIVGLNLPQAKRVMRILKDIEQLPRDERPLAMKRLDKLETHLLHQRGLLIARTEGIRAAALGQIAAWQEAANNGLVNPDVWGKKWLARMDNRVCPLCAALNGTVVGLWGLFDGVMTGPPAHPNAVLEGTTFTPYNELAEMVTAAYEGPAVRIDAGVKSLTIGPNHPVLTTRGLVQAKLVCPGDQLLYDLRHDDPSLEAASEDYFQQVPLVEDAFSALRARTGHSHVAGTGYDLHGDREFCKGEVEVVFAQGPLLNVPQLAGIEQLRKGDFVRSDAGLKLESALGAQAHALVGICLPAPRSMGALSATDSVAAVVAEDAADGACVAGRAAVGTGVLHPYIAVLTVDAVKSVHFKGRAFDATTGGLYASNGFVVSNCRCALGLAKISGEMPTWAQGFRVIPGTRTTGWTAAEYRKLMQTAESTQTALAKAGSWIPNPAWLQGQKDWAEHRWGAHRGSAAPKIRNSAGQFGLRNPEVGLKGAQKLMAGDTDDIDVDDEANPQAVEEWNDAVERELAEVPKAKGKQPDADDVTRIRTELAPQYGVKYGGGKPGQKPKARMLTSDEAETQARLGKPVHTYDQHGFRHALPPQHVPAHNERQWKKQDQDRAAFIGRVTAPGSSASATAAQTKSDGGHLRAYQTNSEWVNGSLRHGKPAAKGAVEALDRVTHSRVLREPMVVYRGIGETFGTKDEEYLRWENVLKTAKPGQLIDDPGFLSTSFDKSIAARFHFRAKYEFPMARIQLPAGTPVGLGEATESELILPRGSRLLVVGRDKDAVTFRYLGTKQHPLPIPTELFAARVKHVEATIDQALAEGRDTQAKYDMLEGQVGHYTPEREAQQKDIVDSILAGHTTAKHERKLVALGGMPGSGKSTFLRSTEGQALIGAAKDYLVADPDEIKDHMAVRGMVPSARSIYLRDEGEAASLVHEESSHILNMLVNQAAQTGTNVILDLSLPNAEQLRRYRQHIEELGGHYDTTVVYVDVPKEVALQRAAERYMAGGRYIRFPWLEDLPLNAQGHTPNRQAYDEVKREVARAVLVENGKVTEDLRNKTDQSAVPWQPSDLYIAEASPWKTPLSGEAAHERALRAMAGVSGLHFAPTDGLTRVARGDLHEGDLIATEGIGGGMPLALVKADGAQAVGRRPDTGELYSVSLPGRPILLARATEPADLPADSVFGYAMPPFVQRSIAKAVEDVRAAIPEPGADLDGLRFMVADLGEHKANVLAEFDANVGMGVPYVVVNSSYVAPVDQGQGQLTGAEYAHNRSLISEWHPNSDAADAVEATVVHEIGHYLHWRAAQRGIGVDMAAEGLLENLSETIPGIEETGLNVLRHQMRYVDPLQSVFQAVKNSDVPLPEYAKRNAREFTAEMVAEAVLSPNPSAVALLVSDYLRARLELEAVPGELASEWGKPSASETGAAPTPPPLVPAAPGEPTKAGFPLKPERMHEVPPSPEFPELPPGTSSAQEWLTGHEGGGKKWPNVVHQYTGYQYHAINDAMLGKPGLSYDDYEKANKLRAVFASGVARLPKPIRTFRASSPRWLHKAGDVFNLAHVASTSVNSKFVHSWAASKASMFDGQLTEWVLDVPAGTHAIWGTANNPGESEVMISPEHDVEVLDAWEASPKHYVMHVRVLPLPDDKPMPKPKAKPKADPVAGAIDKYGGMTIEAITTLYESKQINLDEWIALAKLKAAELLKNSDVVQQQAKKSPEEVAEAYKHGLLTAEEFDAIMDLQAAAKQGAAKPEKKPKAPKADKPEDKKMVHVPYLAGPDPNEMMPAGTYLGFSNRDAAQRYGEALLNRALDALGPAYEPAQEPVLRIRRIPKSHSGVANVTPITHIVKLDKPRTPGLKPSKPFAKLDLLIMEELDLVAQNDEITSQLIDSFIQSKHAG